MRREDVPTWDRPTRDVRRCRAVTLVEVIVASVLLFAVIAGSYQIYRGVSGSVQRAAWSLQAQRQGRDGLRLVREEMQRASYRTICTLSSIATTETGYRMQIKSGSIGPSVSRVTLATWAICQPFSDISPGYVLRATLVLEGNRLLYSRTTAEPVGGAIAGEPNWTDRLIAEEVQAVELSVLPAPAGGRGTMVQLVLTLQDPRNANAQVVERTGAHVEVGIDAL